MFLCDRCHSKKCDCMGFIRSLGPCEDCKKVSICRDCHGRSKTAKKKKAAKKTPKKSS